MTREQAIEIARRCAKAKPQSYYAEPFDPHEWVIDAIMEASRPAATMRPVYDAALALRAVTKRAERAPTLAQCSAQIIDNANAFRVLFDTVDESMKKEPF